ncbi:hypothetical protein ACQEVB_33255 [Pseudonocardia sp. CA-107938]|uniref:hypothetical protein n=1 Tax=Pseudonocardia sp. CA-107938 TaxID=3240021 RepID=UPI003D904935
MDEPISRRGGTLLVLLLAVAIVAGLGLAITSVGGRALAGFDQLGAPVGAASSRAECCSRPAPAAAVPGGAIQGATPSRGTASAPVVRSVVTGGRAPAPPAAVPQPVPIAPASGGLCATLGRTGPPLLQTVLSPIVAVCDVLL